MDKPFDTEAKCSPYYSLVHLMDILRKEYVSGN